MTWQVGDLAVCVDARANPRLGPTGLVEGVIYDVVRVYPPDPPTRSHSLFGHCSGGLDLAGIPPTAPEGFAVERFRKVVQDKREACEDEFVTLLKRCKRKVGA